MKKARRKTIRSSQKPSKRPLKSPSKTVKSLKKKIEKIAAGAVNSVREALVTAFAAPEALAPLFGPRDTRLPERYNEDRMALLVRDPWWIYSYWEVTPDRVAQVDAQIKREGFVPDKTVLRVYDVTDASIDAPHSFFDIELEVFADNWYVDVGKPDCDWIAEIGVRAHGGRFFAWVRSNTVKTPPFGVSDVLDEEWMLPDDVYFRLLGISGLRSGGDSMDFKKLFEKHLKNAISSETIAKLSPKARALRKKAGKA